VADNRGIPLDGDRGAFDTVNYAERHAKDIEDDTLKRHLPAPSADGTYARDDGTNWAAQLGLLLADLTDWVRGSLIVGGVAVWEALGIGAADTVLKSDGTDAAWGNVGHDELTDVTADDHHNLVHDHSAAGEGGQLDWDDIWSDAVHDHSAAGEGGTFDAANLTSGASTDGQVLTSDGAGAAAWEDAAGGDGSVGLVFSQVVDVTVANTTDETTVLGAGRGSKTVPANTLDVGTAIRLMLHGYLSDTGTPTLNIKIKLGGAEVCSTGAIALPSGIDELGWSLEADIVCRTTGAGGTVVAGAMFEFDDDSGRRMVKTGTTAADTTGELLADVTATWGTAAAGNIITCQMASIELLKADDLAVAAPSGLTAVEV